MQLVLFNDGNIGGGYTSTDLDNSNYFRNFGSIPAEYLVRDFRYNGDLMFNGKRDAPIPLSTPPLQHALEYFNSGRYNTNDKDHTSDVKSSGRKIWNETTGSLIDWWNKEGIKWYKASKKK